MDVPLWVFGDPVRYQIITNDAKYPPPGGRIEVERSGGENTSFFAFRQWDQH